MCIYVYVIWQIETACLICVKTAPDMTNLSIYLENIFEDNASHDNDKINYKQWVATDCTTLSCIQSRKDEFIRTANEMIYELCHHHFIKYSQISYLQVSKGNLDNETCVILMDFGEKYSFIMQDAIQGFFLLTK